MIRYPIEETELRERVGETWLKRAEDRTKGFIENHKYEEASSIWSEVKAVYVTLQKGKCAYCERKLNEQELGRVEWDVEHFRPKGNVSQWKCPSSLGDVPQSTIPNPAPGYYRLPYSIWNYNRSPLPGNGVGRSRAGPRTEKSGRVDHQIPHTGRLSSC